MPIDASIYGQIKPVEMPSPLEAAQGAMTLSQLGMQQQAQQYQMAQLQATRQAYARNTDQTGNIDKQGVVTTLSRMGFGPHAAELGQQFAAQDKAQAEALAARADAENKAVGIALPKLEFLDGAKNDQKPAIFHNIMKDLADKGMPMHNVPPEFSQDWLDNTMAEIKKTPTYQAQQQAGATLEETRAKTAEIPGRMAKTAAETAKLQSETYARPTPTALGQTDDPAKLVPYYVPKDHQAKAFEEIKNAQDIKNLTPQIMAAFQKGSSRNPNTAAQGQREFEGLINTTVKETEGTARQAAFDSIHNTMTPSGLTALPGENAAKARTVMEYLQSKSAAPTARGYGIDLAKFAKTSPYQAPADQTAQSSGLGGSVANASTSANTKTAPQNTAGGFSLSEIEAELGRRKGKGK